MLKHTHTQKKRVKMFFRIENLNGFLSLGVDKAPWYHSRASFEFTLDSLPFPSSVST